MDKWLNGTEWARAEKIYTGEGKKRKKNWNSKKNIHDLFHSWFSIRGEAVKLAHLLESASLKKSYMTKNYEKEFIK